MGNVGQGHYWFALIFAVVFVIGIAWAYRKDFKFTKSHYRSVWMVLVGILVVYFIIFIMNRIT